MIRVPKPHGEVAVRLGLRIGNLRHTPLCFALLDSVSIEMTSSDGAVRRMDGGRNPTKRGASVSAPIGPGETLLVDRTAKLIAGPDGEYRLIGADGFGGVWFIDGLRTGAYRLRITYESGAEAADGRAPAPVWAGRVTTEPMEVLLR